jgi:hypothetical protein
MANEAASPFSDVETGGISEYREWFELLQHNRKGCCAIEIQYFRGRAGFATFKQLQVRDEDGKEVQPNTIAYYDADQLGRQAYEACVKDQKKRGHDPRYRLQILVRKKKDGELHVGEFVTLMIYRDGYAEVDDYGRGTESSALKLITDHCKDMRAFTKDLLHGNVAMAQAQAGTMLMIHEAGDAMLERRMQHREQPQRTPWKPDQVLEAFREAGSVVAEPLRLFAYAAAGSGAGEFKPAEQLQAELRTFFHEDLSADQRDELAQALGPLFPTLMAHLEGPVEHFARERRWIRPSLAPFAKQLQQILTSEQWEKLMGLI